MIDDVNKILNERGGTHGDFSTNARITQTIKREMRCEPKWDVLKDHQAEALDMIAHKIGRILAGDPNFKDHWDDIAGYAVLVANRCSQPAAQTPAEKILERMDTIRKPKIGEECRIDDGSHVMWTGRAWVKSKDAPQTAPELSKPRCTICGLCMRINAAGYAMCEFKGCPNAGKKVV